MGVVAVISGSLAFHASKAGLAFVLGGGTRFADGLAGAFVDNNGYALGTVMVLPLLVAAAQNIDLVYDGRWLKWLRRGAFIAVPLCMFAIVGTYSRGGFVSLAAAAIAFVALQRRPTVAIGGLLAAVAIALLVVPIPKAYVDRLSTIQTYKEQGEESALGRVHFWAVARRMLQENPLGVGLRQYEAAYDKYDFSRGHYGHHRAVHSSHFQVLSELGYPGALIWFSMFLYAGFTCLRVRLRSRDPALDPKVSRFLWTTANGLFVSMLGFLVGGSFLSLALNEITWLTFGMVGALEIVTARAIAEAHAEPVFTVPLAFRAVYAINPRRLSA
jgi:putative inorganic carbon (HCO3(-)) transporter